MYFYLKLPHHQYLWQVNRVETTDITDITDPHNTEVHQTDTVQIEAPDYDPEIDKDQEVHTDNKWAMVSIQDVLDNSHDLPELLDNNSTIPYTTTPHQDHIQTDWSDTPTIQIPGVSLTTEDPPPEVTYTRCST